MLSSLLTPLQSLSLPSADPYLLLLSNPTIRRYFKVLFTKQLRRHPSVERYNVRVSASPNTTSRYWRPRNFDHTFGRMWLVSPTRCLPSSRTFEECRCNGVLVICIHDRWQTQLNSFPRSSLFGKRPYSSRFEGSSHSESHNWNC